MLYYFLYSIPCSAIVQNNSNEEQAGYILDLNGFGGCCSKKIGPSRCGYEGYGATLSFSNVTPRYLARSNENIYLHKILSKSVDSIFIQSSPKLDITQMPINSIPVVWSYNEILPCKKKRVDC